MSLARDDPPLKRQDSIGRRYLSSDAMKTTASSLALISSVTNFELVELWVSYPDGEINVVYVYTDDATHRKYPTIITGHHPKKLTKHIISPALVRKVSDSNSNFAFRAEDTNLYPDYYLPFKSEMVYRLEGDTGDLNMFIVGLGFQRIDVKDSTPKFLSGLLYAIFVAAFNSEDTFSADENVADAKELDTKEFVPKNLITISPSVSSSNLVTAGAASDEASSQPMDVDDKFIENGKSSLPDKSSEEPLVEKGPSEAAPVDEPVHALKTGAAAVMDSKIPSWEPASEFSYPVSYIPAKYDVNNQLTFASFNDIRHLADGSNANVFLGFLNGEKVIIKMIKEEVEGNPIAIHEFDQEFGMLARMNHPHIIKVLGAGQKPRKFIVLEWLGGGSLNTILAQHQSSPGLTNMLFRKPSFTYANLLEKARDMAQAFDYLHFRCHPGASILHRDLKPDNIGFTNDGTLKLFDFGLVTCVKARTNSNDSYKMTGYTGSLRYMAPEVALREPYTEKVDVYSFGIMLWQMAKDRLPFKGLNKAEFLRDVVRGGMRPKLDKTWPQGFSQLLSRCWHTDPNERPSFAMILIDLNKLIADTCGNSNSASAPRGKLISKGKSISKLGTTSDTQSSWF